MAAAILGGELVQHLAPAQALHTAAAIVGVAPFLVIFGTLFLIDEKRVSVNVQGIKATLHGLVTAFKRRELLIVAAFIFLYYFSPGLATPLYYHMTDELKFSQAYIGILSSIGAAGWVVGALLYRRFLGRSDDEDAAQSEHRARHGDDAVVFAPRQAKRRRPSSISAPDSPPCWRRWRR